MVATEEVDGGVGRLRGLKRYQLPVIKEVVSHRDKKNTVNNVVITLYGVR